jgi:hypothetical protein
MKACGGARSGCARSWRRMRGWIYGFGDTVMLATVTLVTVIWGT